MKILLTGFEAFGSVRVNPSEQIVREIAARARSSGEDDLVTEILPTEFVAAGKRIKRLLRSIRPAVVVCLGVAASRDKISLERVALNLNDDASPDNAGRVRSGRTIVRGGPLAYGSTLPLGRIQKILENGGFRSEISNHAGTYVCNHVFYVALHEVERMGGRIRCGFIHVPELRSLRKGSKARGMALSQMVAAVECCLKALRDRKA